MRATFVELPPFKRHREEYLRDDGYLSLQMALMGRPDAGDVIQGTGGLRKIRFGDVRRGKGKRGGLRVIYYYWVEGNQFWMFTLYDKGELDDLSAKERSALADMLKEVVELYGTKQRSDL
jgi:hypothetical protein